MIAPIEPSAEIRNAAKGLREIFIALTQEGFSEQQSLVILGQMMAANNS